VSPDVPALSDDELTAQLATAADEAVWLDLARFTTAAQLEKTVRGVERSRQDPKPHDARPAAAQTRWDDNGTLVLTLRIGAAHTPAVLAALQSAPQAEQTDRDAMHADLVSGRAAGADVSAEARTPPSRSRTPCTSSRPTRSGGWR
jgi:hypothetical protein